MKSSFLSLIALLSILACDSGTSDSAYRSSSESKAVAPAMQENLSSNTEQVIPVKVTSQKIIRNGSMTMSVKNATETRRDIQSILDKHHAYVGNEQLENSDYQTTYAIQIRVPSDHLDALVTDLESLKGTVTSKSIQARDVTEEFIDLESRLTNKKAYLDQYRSLLKTARSIEDILKVQEQIRALEEEIESVTGRLKYLSNQVDLSTLDLTLTETKDYVYRPDRRINFLERFKEALSAGWHGFVNFILLMIGIWPFWLILIVLLWWWRQYERRKKRIPKV